MKMTKVAWGLAFAAGLVASGSALADRGHGRVTFGINFGVPVGPWYYPPYYPPVFYPPYYPSYPPYLPTVVVSPSAPPVYVEKGGGCCRTGGFAVELLVLLHESARLLPLCQGMFRRMDDGAASNTRAARTSKIGARHVQTCPNGALLVSRDACCMHDYSGRARRNGAAG